MSIKLKEEVVMGWLVISVDGSSKLNYQNLRYGFGKELFDP